MYSTQWCERRDPITSSNFLYSFYRRVRSFFSTIAMAGLFGSSWDDDRSKADSCYDSVLGDPQTKPLDGKLSAGKPSLSELADERIPTDVDVQSLQFMTQKFVGCRELMLAAVRKHYPFAVSALETHHFRMDLVYVQLHKQRMAFGNANKLIYESYLEYSTWWQRYAQARSDEERRRLAESMRDLSRQFQSSPPPSGTGRMTCRWVGPTLYCDQY